MAMKQSPSSNLEQSTHSTSTPEYIAMHKCYKMMVSHITQSVGDFCDALFSEGYISLKVCDYARKESILEMERAEKLVDTMIDRIKYDPKAFHSFVKMFEEEGSWGMCVVEELRKGYKYGIELQRSAIDVEDHSSSDESFHSLDGSFQKLALVSKDPSSPDTGNDKSIQRALNVKSTATESQEAIQDVFGFVCPCCKKCMVEDFFSKPEKHSSENETLFPYLKTTDLSEDEGEDLEAKLVSDLKKIVHHYAVTEDSVIGALESQDLGTDRVRKYVWNLVISTPTSQQTEVGIELKKADSVVNVFEAIRPFKSFFNYEIVESVVDQFGSPVSYDMMTEYVTAFNEFCKRSVFQVPPNMFQYQIKNSDDKVFSVKFTLKVIPTLGDVFAVRNKIASILNVSVWALRLCSIKKGCVCLTFLVPAHLADKIFPVSPSQQIALSEIHIRVLQESGPSHFVGERHQDKARSEKNVQSLLPSHQPKRSDDIETMSHDPQLSSLQQQSYDPEVPSPPQPSLTTPLSTQHLTDEPEIQHLLITLSKEELSEELVAACKRGSLSEISSLIEQGADVDYCIIHMRKKTPLIAACERGHSETVKMLIDGKADLNKSDQRKKTPLIAACERGHSETVKMLIDVKADLNKSDQYERTPLIAACAGGHSEAVKMLIDGKADLNKRDHRGRTPLTTACMGGHSETVKLLINGKADLNKVKYGWTPLMAACKEGHSEIFKMLIDGKADLNNFDWGGKTPLMAACKEGHSEIVTMLIGRKADLNSCDRGGRTPLMHACESGHSETVKILIDGKASLNIVDHDGRTPLVVACKGGHCETVKMLIDAKADLNKCDRYGRTPLILSCERGHSETVKMLINGKADLDKVDHGEITPLMAACKGGHSETVKMLIDAKADLNKVKLGRTLLIVACEGGHSETVKMLIDEKADLNKSDWSGWTPLIAACGGGHSEIVRMLIDGKADLNKVMAGHSPLYIARWGGHSEIERMLAENGAEMTDQDKEHLERFPPPPVLKSTSILQYGLKKPVPSLLSRVRSRRRDNPNFLPPSLSLEEVYSSSSHRSCPDPLTSRTEAPPFSDETSEQRKSVPLQPHHQLKLPKLKGDPSSSLEFSSHLLTSQAKTPPPCDDGVDDENIDV